MPRPRKKSIPQGAQLILGFAIPAILFFGVGKYIGGRKMKALSNSAASDYATVTNAVASQVKPTNIVEFVAATDVQPSVDGAINSYTGWVDLGTTNRLRRWFKVTVDEHTPSGKAAPKVQIFETSAAANAAQ